MTYRRSDMHVPDGPLFSERLHYTKLSQADEAAMWEMVSSENVMRYIHRDVETDRAAWQESFSKELADGERYKFFYGFHWRDPAALSDGILGLVILRPTEDARLVEIGYWIREKYWGKGLATEANKAMLALAEDMKIPKQAIMATVNVGNYASRKVLEKSGLSVIGEIKEQGDICWSFRFTS